MTESTRHPAQALRASSRHRAAVSASRRALGRSSALLFGLACACGDASTATPTDPATQLAAGGGAAPLAPAVPSATPVNTPAAPTLTPTTPVASTTPPVAVTGAAGAPGTAAPVPTTTPDVAAMTPGRYPDACSERRGSWSKPCSTNPDPCNLKSGFPGDDYCLLPPPAGKGIQIHFGPKTYDAATAAPYVIKPGEEFNSYGIVNVPTTEEKFFTYVKISMRPGSHHLINNLMSGHPAEGFLKAGAGCDGEMLGSFPGTQNLITETPPQGIPAPENEGLGRSLPANASLCQNYHRYNNTETPTLSEIWYNIWFADEKDITQKTQGVNITAGPYTPIAAHSMVTLTTTSTVGGAGRIISLFGHRHAATERFAAWLNDELVYDSWDWVEARLFNYDSVTDNPAPNPTGKTDGATSGIMNVKSGDKIKIECHVNNTTDQALKFANELYTGEMCILFGSTVGVAIK